MTDKYICYNDLVKDSLITLGIGPRSLIVAENSINNSHCVGPKDKNGNETGILFIGRLRENNGLRILARCIKQINSKRTNPIVLHVIGGGLESDEIKELDLHESCLKVYGEIHDQARITEISLHCFAGCYPGNAGLSILHFMSLSLVPITHNKFHIHQGPEAYYIKDGVNGLLFEYNDPDQSLYKTIIRLTSDPGLIERLQIKAFETYEQLVNPPLSQRFLSILRK